MWVAHSLFQAELCSHVMSEGVPWPPVSKITLLSPLLYCCLFFFTAFVATCRDTFYVFIISVPH